MEACELVLWLLSEMRRKGGNSARIACFQLGKRLQITLRGGIIKLFGCKGFEGTQGLRSTSEQQITNRPPMEILHGLCERCTDTNASTKLFVGSFEPRSNINCIAIGGVIEEAGTAEIPDDRASPASTARLMSSAGFAVPRAAPATSSSCPSAPAAAWRS